MRKILLPALTLAALTFSAASLACSLKTGYKLVTPVLNTGVLTEYVPDAPTTPTITIKRGSYDGNPGSCSDAGIITLELHDKPHRNIIGYTVRVVSGSLPDHVFPEAVIAPMEAHNNRLVFGWLDKPFGEAIDVTIELRRVSIVGIEGEPRTLYIQSSGK